MTGADYTYSYDANKNKLKETINAPLANYGFGSTVGQEATYDGEDRLTNWHRDDTLRDLNWVITKVGDFSSYSVEGVAETRTHTAAHELTNIVGGGNPGALAYDPKGNLTTRSDNFAFVWDFDNQLKEVTVPVGSALGNVGTHKYSYDALGRRVLKHVAGEKRLIFVHDGQQIIAEYKYTNGVIGIPGGIDAGTSTTSQATQTTQTQSNAAVVIGTRRGTATIQRKYMYTSYIDERCLMVDRTALGSSPAGTEELFYYHSNNLYSTGAMTDAAGAVTERYAYDAYGQIVFLNAAGAPLATQASTIGQPYTYTGRRLDEETFLNHYRARYYDAFIMQRFIGRDRILYGDGYNMYQYVGGRPLVAMDPTGLYEEEWEGTWTKAQKDRVTDSFGRIVTKAAALQLEIDRELASLSPAVARRLRPELMKLRAVLGKVVKGINSTEENLELYHYDLGARYSDAMAVAITATIGDNELRFNDAIPTPNSHWETTLVSNFDELVFHELTHFYGTEDDDTAGLLMNAHTIQRMINGSVVDNPMYVNMKNQAIKECQSEGSSPFGDSQDDVPK